MQISSQDKTKNLALIIAGVAIPLIASRATKRIIGSGYRALSDREPPKNPASPTTAWKDALAWSILTGAAGGVSRLIMRKILAHTSIPTEGYDHENQEKALGGSGVSDVGES
ncbi:DUF4235 domain-containing protein [Rubritalea spongiae]|uniref:DUF4235 domain-containing protein n=1 Tax=Rubritalea spongiae TaxID=430797 RepID=A0ABW5DZD8_9BACT